MDNNYYMRKNLSDEYGILKLQNKILEIMIYIDQFCKEHNVTYYLMGGSALGAKRHEGFIPWDDDLDIFMDYLNYNKFLDCCDKYLDTKRFYLQKQDTEENPYFFSKLRMNGTTCLNSILPRGHQGIFVDIMCLYNAPKGKFAKKVQYYSAGLLKARSITKTNYHTKSYKKKVELLIARIFVRGNVKKWLYKNVKKYQFKASDEYAHVFGRAKFINSFYPKKDFGKPRYVPFETVQLSVPENIEEYLTIRYGADYMKMPDVKTKAEYQSHAMIWDVDTDYTEYIDKQK